MKKRDLGGNYMVIKPSLTKLKDPKTYLENFTKIKPKKPGPLLPFILNEAQKDLFNSVRRFNRVIILKARQIGFCGSPETKVLTVDLRWITLDEIKEGQEIVAVDEFPKKGRGNGRKMKTAIVEKKCNIYESAYRLTMDDDRELIFTGNHRFLSKKNGSSETVWRKVKDFKIGNEIRYITKSWEKPTFEDGWFSGMIDGEGSLSKKSRTGVSLTVSQVEGPVWDELLRYVSEKGYSFRIEWDRRKSESSSKFGNKPVGKVVISRMDEVFRLLGQLRPFRIINRKWWEGKDLPGKCSGIGWSKVVKIELLPKQRMIDLQTSEKTYIAEGFVSHNSTAMVGFFYHNTITNPGTTTALIGYNSDLTSELLDKVKVFYRTTPPSLRPTIQYNSKYEISFPRINSKILVLPSTQNVGRGYTLTNVLATELSAWDDAEEKMMTLEASVPIEGKLVIESTPRGQGNLYHRMWMADDNDYDKREYGWWWGYTQEEIDVIRKRMNNPSKFAQEYGLEFLASGRAVFDPYMLRDQRENVWKLDNEYEQNGNIYRVKEVDHLRIYKEPVDGRNYVAGVDVSEGVEGGDFSVVHFFDRFTGEEVAMFRGLLAPDRLADKLYDWGMKYNKALMVVEINNHGLTTLTCLKQKIYPSLYFRPKKIDSLGVSSSDKFGWKTTKVTRPLLIDELAQACRDKEVVIHSKELLDEMSVFIYDDSGNMVPQSGFHDDCIFAAGIAWQGFKLMPKTKLVQLDYKKHLPKSFAY